MNNQKPVCYGVDYSRWTGAREMFEELTAGNKEKKIRLINIGEPQITRESFYQQLLRQIPFPTKTAAFFLSDYFAIEAISYLGSKGIRVPADLGIAGFDDINYAHLTVPEADYHSSEHGAEGRAGCNRAAICHTKSHLHGQGGITGCHADCPGFHLISVHPATVLPVPHKTGNCSCRSV